LTQKKYLIEIKEVENLNNDNNNINNNKCGCESEYTECVDESIKGNSFTSPENECECGEKSADKSEEDNNCGCDEKSEETADGFGCGEESNETPEKNDCGCEEKSEDIIEEDAGCGCGCGDTEYPDQSTINNPDKPEFIASDDFIKEFEKYGQSIGIASIGYAQLTPDLLIKDKFIPYPHTIVLTMEMDKKIIEAKPGAEAQKLNDAAYAKLGEITYRLSDYLRENGYATQVAHPYESIVNFTPLAQKAGLGWIGQSGLLITPEFGPRQKISTIFVSIANLPVKEGNEHSWVSDYCERCGKCVKACPEKALIEKETCCGDKETELVQKRCIGCSQGCTYCIEDCPFDTKGYDHLKIKFDKMNAKLMEKKRNKCC
jgi:epoxyqueuosine reductase QueG